MAGSGRGKVPRVHVTVEHVELVLAIAGWCHAVVERGGRAAGQGDFELVVVVDAHCGGHVDVDGQVSA